LCTEGYLRSTTANPTTMYIDHVMAGCLLPLLEGGTSFQALRHRWIQLHPINPVTMAPVTLEDAYLPLQQLLAQLATVGYVMLEVA
jgi:hypothetical protein